VTVVSAYFSRHGDPGEKEDKAAIRIFEWHGGRHVSSGTVVSGPAKGERDIQYDVPEDRAEQCRQVLKKAGFRLEPTSAESIPVSDTEAPDVVAGRNEITSAIQRAMISHIEEQFKWLCVALTQPENKGVEEKCWDIFWNDCNTAITAYNRVIATWGTIPYKGEAGLSQPSA